MAITGWVRSCFAADDYEQAFSQFAAMTIQSKTGCIQFSFAWSPLPYGYHTQWLVTPASAASPAGFPAANFAWSFLGLGFYRGTSGLSHFVGWRIPYWMIAVPTAILPVVWMLSWARSRRRESGSPRIAG
ncbi:MAG TPA: hypothetical protein VMD30_06420 [Tepidisphaeraceae bacterium]|nr:hypothetical protein [Tepidisphaeraceae bacterium]